MPSLLPFVFGINLFQCKKFDNHKHQNEAVPSEVIYKRNNATQNKSGAKHERKRWSYYLIIGLLLIILALQATNVCLQLFPGGGIAFIGNTSSGGSNRSTAPSTSTAILHTETTNRLTEETEDTTEIFTTRSMRATSEMPSSVYAQNSTSITEQSTSPTSITHGESTEDVEIPMTSPATTDVTLVDGMELSPQDVLFDRVLKGNAMYNACLSTFPCNKKNYNTTIALFTTDTEREVQRVSVKTSNGEAVGNQIASYHILAFTFPQELEKYAISSWDERGWTRPVKDFSC